MSAESCNFHEKETEFRVALWEIKAGRLIAGFTRYLDLVKATYETGDPKTLRLLPQMRTDIHRAIGELLQPDARVLETGFQTRATGAFPWEDGRHAA